ncbi:mannose-1-phosphate guanylyltransferase [Microbacterium aerolatum]|uniref:Mannose-1-phosphate guanyltransferase n=1 Tax=Microbacterium aerolatum TaxID=153731 RepID=A0A511AGP0_9MICO|nr:mannose-1-phosphate guanylyltransferase [Microbacterium aerolatum]MCK3769874.1 sugar phosphate nucleotidyltransferase [Microbacterium aerolatum]GEK87152.1 mannose-1-phosphate guanyltransferase [Microbacterium aerolatum]GGB36385.1 mannose-1-phosphate guanyltransferase [Microbacterium aerolatum]
MSEPFDDFYAVIPAGGIGSRLWPLSRADAPKFLHDLTGSGNSLLRDTWDRLEPLAGPERISVVTGRAHRAAVEAELPGIPDMNVFLESEPRDSAAAIGLAAAILHRRNPDVIIGSFAADHVIRGTRTFEFAVQQAVAVARAGYICTIGIQPSEPSVGFGYIHKGDELVVDGAPEAATVERFVEKPDLETAKQYYADRSFLWNAGMFISKASVLLDELAANEPELHAGLLELAEAWDDRERRGPTVDRVWPRLKKIAIDYAVAEPAADKGRLAVIPGHFDWDDVGDFASLTKLISAGRKNDLAVLGPKARVLSDAATGILVSQTSRVISLIGVQDIVVVDTPDALLVTTTEHAQRVKGVVESLKLSGRGDVL